MITIDDETLLMISALASDANANPDLRRRALALAVYASGGDSNAAAAASGLSASRARYWRLMCERHGADALSASFQPPKPARRSSKRDEPFALTGAEADMLRGFADDELRTEEDRRKAIILLRYHAGDDTAAIARDVGLSDSRTRFWRKAFLNRRLSMFHPASDTFEIRRTRKTRASTPGADGPRSTAEPGTLPNDGPGLLAADHMRSAARKVFSFHLRNLLHCSSQPDIGVEIETVHHMRVAAQRMRMVLALFASYFDSDEHPALEKRLKKLRRKLGKVRDLDVMLEHMIEYREGIGTQDAEAFSALLLVWQRKRDGQLEELRRYLDSRSFISLLNSCQLFLAEEDSKPERDRLADPRQRVEFVSPMLVLDRYFEVLSFSPLIPQASIEQLHALRKSLKRLRYTLEFFREILGDTVQKNLKTIISTQDYLGELQDAQTTAEILTPVLLDFDADQNSIPVHERLNPAPLLDYLARRQEHKYTLILNFHPVWEQLVSRQFRKRLLRSLIQA